MTFFKALREFKMLWNSNHFVKLNRTLTTSQSTILNRFERLMNFSFEKDGKIKIDVFIILGTSR